MEKTNSNQLYDDIGQEFADRYGTEGGQMFGKPCLKTGKKAFVAFFQGQMVFKLGQEEVNLLRNKYPGSVNWDPSGKKRPMKDWLQVPEEFSGSWTQLAKQALDYVKEDK